MNDGLLAARALLRAEGRGLRILRTKVREGTRRLAGAAAALPRASARPTAERAAALVQAEASGLTVQLASAVRSVRLGSKRVSHERFVASWELVRRGVIAQGERDPGPLGIAAMLAPTDEVAAVQLAHSLSSAWMSVAVSAAWAWAERPDAELAAALTAVNVDGRVRRAAATEAARAFADGFDEGAGWVVEHHRRARWYPGVLKRWEAANDRKVCRVCATLGDSAPRPIGVPFPGGMEPGYAHAFCRCVPEMVFLAGPA